MAGMANISSTSDPYWDNVVALLHFENGFTDEKAFSWTNSNNLITDSQFRFGTSSLSTGSGYTTVSNNILGLTDADSITFEGWVRFSSYVADGVIFQLGPNNALSTGRIIGLRMRQEGNLAIYFGTTVLTVCSADIPDFALDRWYFVVAQVGPRISGRRTSKLFVDGVLLASGDPANISGLAPSDIFSLGQGYWTAVKRMDGYIDEFRITKGVARYTEDFDPPTRPFPNS